MNRVALYSSVQSGGTDGLVKEYTPLVKRIAYHLLNRLPDSVQVDDLTQAGMLGLLEAIKHFDATQGASFETYAGIRIRGAMLDDIRRLDWTPRSVHKKSRMIGEAIRAIENKTGKQATEQLIIEYLQISAADYHHILQDASSCHLFSADELTENGHDLFEQIELSEQAQDDRLSHESFQQALANAISELPERERLIVSLYYDDELNLREIGEVLSISESRVSQLSSQAILRLRSRLREWLE
jgi:RNA polymerase sigma factor for flagellar operon FliA